MKKLFSRFTVIALTIILMFIVNVSLVFFAYWLLEQALLALFPSASRWISIAFAFVSWLAVFSTVLNLVNRDMVPEAKLSWLVVVLTLNVFGVMIYAVFSHNRPSRGQRRKFAAVMEQTNAAIVREQTESAPVADMGRWSGVSEALFRGTSAAVAQRDTATEYFPTGEAFFERLKADLAGAKKFIFMEYFILAKGKMWGEILDILRRKANEGVEVRVIYDDVGCMGRLRAGYAKTLSKEGIACVKFSPFVPVVTNVHNNRDHRKITVIDGEIGYTGGINLADEYINETSPFGYWKDTAIRLQGRAVEQLTLLFLQTYNARKKETEDFAPFLGLAKPVEAAGVVQVYGDGPKAVYGKNVGEDVYLDLINGARESLYITTPYLIIDFRLREALLRASARGVDVRILTPHVPDKKVPFALTRSNYLSLVRGGVKIYEYTPGFVHAKSVLADGEIGVVGSINFDYRSLLHHFECAALLYRTSALDDLRRDLEACFAVSELQTEESAKKSVVLRVVCEIAKVFAPLF